MASTIPPGITFDGACAGDAAANAGDKDSTSRRSAHSDAGVAVVAQALSIAEQGLVRGGWRGRIGRTRLNNGGGLGRVLFWAVIGRMVAVSFATVDASSSPTHNCFQGSVFPSSYGQRVAVGTADDSRIGYSNLHSSTEPGRCKFLSALGSGERRCRIERIGNRTAGLLEAATMHTQRCPTATNQGSCCSHAPPYCSCCDSLRAVCNYDSERKKSRSLFADVQNIMEAGRERVSSLLEGPSMLDVTLGNPPDGRPNP